MAHGDPGLLVLMSLCSPLSHWIGLACMTNKNGRSYGVWSWVIKNTTICLCLGFFFFFFAFLSPHLQHMEVPRLGVKSELQLRAYTTATVMPDPSHVCDLYHSSQQCRILNPLSKFRDQTCVLMNPSQIHFWCAMMGTPVSGITHSHGQPAKVLWGHPSKPVERNWGLPPTANPNLPALEWAIWEMGPPATIKPSDEYSPGHISLQPHKRQDLLRHVAPKLLTHTEAVRGNTWLLLL